MLSRKQYCAAKIIALGVLAAIPNADAFVVAPSPAQARCSTTTTFAEGGIEGGIDVSDLGLTMDDLNAPLPEEAFQLTKSGTQSTSRVPGVDDDGCVWEETAEDMEVTLSIPGRSSWSAACRSCTGHHKKYRHHYGIRLCCVVMHTSWQLRP